MTPHPDPDPLSALAARVVTRLNALDPAWRRGYVRVEVTGDRTLVTASIEKPNGGEVLDRRRHGSWIRALAAPLQRLHRQTRAEDPPFRVALLMVDSTYRHMIGFDCNDPTRWRIAEEGRSAGIPWGL